MTAQITGLSQAQRNANDGISVAQTAEGALNQINDNVQRIRELSVQAQNGTNSADDLQSIQDEITQRLTEIDRISAETSFNGVEVLAKNQKLSIQVGANDGQRIDVGLQEINAATLGLSTFNVTGPAGTLGAVDYAAIYGDTTTVTQSAITENGFEAALASRLGVTAAEITVAAGNTLQEDENGNLFVAVTIESTSDTDTENLALRGINVANGATETFYVAISPDDLTANGTDAEFEFDAALANSLDFRDLSQGRTGDPLATLDAALNQIDSLRSELGAVQNRFEDAISNLQTNETNLSAARSRIEDADYASEVANMTRAQILQQAGTSVLAQANQIPQNVLSLLG